VAISSEDLADGAEDEEGADAGVDDREDADYGERDANVGDDVCWAGRHRFQVCVCVYSYRR
jgi:hypothetical protein